MDKLNELERALVFSPATLTPSVRRQIVDRARCLALQRPTESGLDSWIEALTDAVVADPVSANVDSYLEQGKTEAQIFEVVTAAALGVALARADVALPALRRSR
jgi:hypothetical protein